MPRSSVASLISDEYGETLGFKLSRFTEVDRVGLVKDATSPVALR